MIDSKYIIQGCMFHLLSRAHDGSGISASNIELVFLMIETDTIRSENPWFPRPKRTTMLRTAPLRRTAMRPQTSGSPRRTTSNVRTAQCGNGDPKTCENAKIKACDPFSWFGKGER